MNLQGMFSIMAAAAVLFGGARAATAAQPVTAKVPAAIQGSAGVIEISSLLGTTVLSSQGEKLGSIKDVVLDSQDGQATFVVVDAQAAGTGHSMLVVPYPALRLGFNAVDNRSFTVLNLRLDQIAAAPQIRNDQWQLLGNPYFMTQAREFYQVRTYTAARPIPEAAAAPALPVQSAPLPPCVNATTGSDLPKDLEGFYSE